MKESKSKSYIRSRIALVGFVTTGSGSREDTAGSHLMSELGLRRVELNGGGLVKYISGGLSDEEATFDYIRKNTK